MEKNCPDMIGKYKILSLIEKRWYADEFLCIDKTRNAVWSILVYQKADFSEQSLRCFLEDMRRFRMLDHPLLPHIEDIIEQAQYIYVVREYIEGSCLQEMVESDGLRDQYDLKDFAKQLCDCLSYLNLQKDPIILKNLNPSNIWIKPSFELVISALDEPRYPFETCWESFKTGFAAPEVGFDSLCDCRTDIFSVGAILLYCLTGKELLDIALDSSAEKLMCGQSAALYYYARECTNPQRENRIQDYEELLWRLGIREEPPVRIRRSFNYQIGRLYWKYKFVPVLGRILFTCHIISGDRWKEYKRMQRNHSNIGK